MEEITINIHCVVFVNTQPGPYGRVNDPYDGDWALGPLGGKAVTMQVCVHALQYVCIYMHVCVFVSVYVADRTLIAASVCFLYAEVIMGCFCPCVIFL